MILLGVTYTILWAVATWWQVGVIHFRENRDCPRLNNKPRYIEEALITAFFILPALLSTILVYGIEYQKPIKGVTYR